MTQQKKDVFWNTMGSAMYGANSFLMLVVVSNTASLSITGSFSISWTTAQLLYIIGLFGANFYQMTDYKEEYQFSDYFWLRVGTCILMIAGCLLYAFQQNEREKFFYLAVLTMYMIVNAFGDIYQSFFFQQRHVDTSGKMLFFRTLVPLCVFVIFQIVIRNLSWSILSMFVCNLVITSLYGAQSRRQNKIFITRPQANLIIGLLKSCIPLFISVFLMNLIVNLPRYNVEWQLNNEMQGYFSMLFIPAQVINLCSQFVFKPLLSGYNLMLEKNDKSAFWKSLLKQFLFILIFTLFCCFGGAFLGIPVLSLVYGTDLNGYAGTLIVIILGGGSLAAAQLLYYIMVLIRKQSWIMWTYGIVSLTAWPITWIFVGKMGLLGAANSFVVLQLLIILLELIGMFLALQTEKCQRGKL